MVVKKNNSREVIKKCITKRPITFMKLVSETKFASETVEKYLKDFSEEMITEERKGKYRIIYSRDTNKEIINFYELLLNPTINLILIILLNSKEGLSQKKLVLISKKSNPSISRGLKIMYQNQIIQREYNSPYSTYEIKNKKKIYEKLKITYPQIFKGLRELK